MNIININEFRFVRPKASRETYLSLSVIWDGRIHLNGKLLEKIGSSYIFLRVNQDGTQILMEPLEEQQEDSLRLPKNGDIKMTEFHKDLETLGLRFPVYYSVSWNADINMWHGIYCPDKTSSVIKNKQKKLNNPRKTGLKDMVV